MEPTIRTFMVSLIGAAALAAGLVLLRQQKDSPLQEKTSNSGETPGEPDEGLPDGFVLDRLRAAGI